MQRPARPASSTLITSLVLALLVAADLAGVGHVAGAVDPETDAEPAALPDAAFLTGRDAPSTTVQGVLARIEESPEGYHLRLTNAGEEPRSVDFEAVCFQQVGSPMSRMGMQRQEVATDRVVATLAPGQTRVQKLACAPQKRWAPEGMAPGMNEDFPTGGFDGAFSTTDFEIFAGGTPPEARRGSLGLLALGSRRGKIQQARNAAPPKVVEPLARLRVSRLLEGVAAAAPNTDAPPPRPEAPVKDEVATAPTPTLPGSPVLVALDLLSNQG